MSVLAVASIDPVLHVVAPISLAAAAGTAVIIDRDPGSGWPFPVGSLSELVTSGPTAADLHPADSGIALLGGPVPPGPRLDALLEALQTTWPSVVIRSQPAETGVLRIDPALPWRAPSDVTVGTSLVHTASASIPAPSPRLLRRLLRGEIDPRWRWFRRWRPIWEMAR